MTVAGATTVANMSTSDTLEPLRRPVLKGTGLAIGDGDASARGEKLAIMATFSAFICSSEGAGRGDANSSLRGLYKGLAFHVAVLCTTGYAFVRLRHSNILLTKSVSGGGPLSIVKRLLFGL